MFLLLFIGLIMSNYILATIDDNAFIDQPVDVPRLSPNHRQLKTNAVQTFKSRAQREESEIVFRTV